MQCSSCICTSNASFQLWDEDGEFLMVPSDTDHPTKVTSKAKGEEMSKVELLCQYVTDITRERDTLSYELETIRRELEARIKELWRMSCGQFAEYDAMITSKDEGIA